MRGWNVCTDLYRIIEHVYDHLRADPAGKDEKDGVTSFLACANRIDSHAAQKLLRRLVGDLPLELRRVKPMTGDIEVDRLGFIGEFTAVPSNLHQRPTSSSRGRRSR